MTITTFPIPTTTNVTATGTPAPRSLADRFGEVFDWKDYGALGDGTGAALSTRYGSLGAAQAIYPHVSSLTQTIDWAGIQAAVNAMYAAGGGTCYGPRGSYNMGGSSIAKQINLGGGPSVGCGRFVGAGIGATTISGTFNDDYLVNMPHQTNGVAEVSDMSILNFSSYIGTGALRYCQNNAQGLVKNMLLGGMGSLEMGWNVFNTNVISIISQGNGQTVSPYGSIGMTNGGANVFGWREAASHEIAMTICGANTLSARSFSFEITPVGLVVGQLIVFATKCTITGTNGNKVLTVASDAILYPPAAATQNPISSGDLLVLTGVDPRVNPEIRINAQLTDTSVGQGGHEQGTYSLTGADGVTISTPQVITIRRIWPASNFDISCVQGEGNGIGVYVMSSGNGRISSIGIGGVITQGCTNQYGGNRTGTFSASPQCGFFISSASQLTIANGGADSHGAVKAAIQFHGLYTNAQKLRLEGITGSHPDDAVTDSSAFLDNGAGITLVTNGSTATNNNILHFAAGTIDAAVVAGVPVINVTDVTHISVQRRVASVNNGAGTVTLDANIGGSAGVASGETIKFCVPSGVAGGVLTVQGLTGVIGRITDVHAPGLDTVGAPMPKGGAAVTGSGVSTGTNTPMIKDMVGGWNGGGYAQYTLCKADGSSVSLNLSARVFTMINGKSWGVDNLTGLSGIAGNTKSGIELVQCNNDSTLDMVYADLPGETGVSQTLVVKGMCYDIVDGAKSGGGAAAMGDATQGGGTGNYKVRYNGTSWIRNG